MRVTEKAALHKMRGRETRTDKLLDGFLLLLGAHWFVGGGDGAVQQRFLGGRIRRLATDSPSSLKDEMECIE